MVIIDDIAGTIDKKGFEKYFKSIRKRLKTKSGCTIMVVGGRVHESVFIKPKSK